jgi:multidrug efflux system membrane fusion protein
VSVHKVKLGPSDGTNTAILSGLAVGDSVVVDGTDRLSDGAKISVATATPAAAPPPESNTPSAKKSRGKPPQGAAAQS